ncbi:MAG TPA: glycosyltransferase [Lacunisphaera sp.]|jgi:glycosyltransferase involved in cell wall biosynthesis
MNNLRLSIITVTKDDAAGLARTLASARLLRTADVEQLVVDGGTNPEATGKIAAESGGGVIVIARPPQGIADAFNAGIAAAHGEWVWFLNGGDAVHETLDAAWLLALLAGTRAQVVTGAVQYDGAAAPRAMPPLATQWPLLTCWLAHPATLIRREKLVAIGGFNPRLQIAMDYDLWHRVFSGSAVDVLSIPFARFDVNGISQRLEMHGLVCREEASVLLSHGGKLAGAVFRTGGNFIRRMIWALAHWRPRGQDAKHGRD